MKNMKKRILAIFLCLILTVSLAAAVAAEDFTVTLPPNILPPNICLLYTSPSPRDRG